MTTSHVPVLMYHSVSDHSSAAFAPYTVSPQRFREHMSTIAARGHRVLTVGQHVGELAGARADDTRPAVVITFDDAFADFHSTALPILAEFGFAATLYVPSAFVGKTSRWLAEEGEGDRPIIAWSALIEAMHAGVEVGSHSRSHADLDLAPAPRLRAEVVDSKGELEDRLQVPVTTFAYPFGHSNAAVRRAVIAAGYSSGVAVRDLASGGESAHRMNRWTVHGEMTARDLDALLDTRTGRLAAMRSDARSLVSVGLRRSGLKRHADVLSETSGA